jgi:hypothetical protein
VAVQASAKASHGRREQRELWLLGDPELNAYLGSAGTVGQPWPHLQQIGRLRRVRVVKGRIEVGVSYLITSIPAKCADANTLLRLGRNYWGIENRLHWVRDVTLDEDRAPIRTGAAPQVCAGLRNLMLALLRRSGVSNIAAALRTYAARPRAAARLLHDAHPP